ncbi:MAG: hypothetical protein ACRD1X_04025, partial [Vicinamibacteria bacterium]
GMLAYRRLQQGECRARVEANARAQRNAVDGFRRSPVSAGIQEEFARIEQNIASRQRRFAEDTQRDFQSERARMSADDAAFQARIRSDVEEYYRSRRSPGPTATHREIGDHAPGILEGVLERDPVVLVETAVADGMGSNPPWFRTIDENPEAGAAVENRVRLEELIDEEIQRWSTDSLRRMAEDRARDLHNSPNQGPVLVPGRR